MNFFNKPQFFYAASHTNFFASAAMDATGYHICVTPAVLAVKGTVAAAVSDSAVWVAALSKAMTLSNVESLGPGNKKISRTTKRKRSISSI